MAVETLVRDLRRLAVQTGHVSTACLGCGYERSCSVHGCQLIQQAADQLEDLNQFTDSEILKLLRRISQLEIALRSSEAARTDLAQRLRAAQKTLHETKSDCDVVHCQECIYIQDHKTYVACDKLNYGVDLSCGYCSAGRRRDV